LQKTHHWPERDPALEALISWFFVFKVLVVQVFTAQAAIEFVAYWLLFNSPLAMHWFVVYLGRAAGHVAAKTCHVHARQVVVITAWWAAPRYSFSSDTLPPLTLFSMVVLRHVLRVERKRGQSKISYLSCGLRSAIFLNFDLTPVAV
jgi:hypothetical protein